MRAQWEFRLEADGRTLGRFDAAEAMSGGVSLAGWRPERVADKPVRGTIVLQGPGSEMRRWECDRIVWEAAGVSVRRLRRA